MKAIDYKETRKFYAKQRGELIQKMLIPKVAVHVLVGLEFYVAQKDKSGKLYLEKGVCTGQTVRVNADGEYEVFPEFWLESNRGVDTFKDGCYFSDNREKIEEFIKEQNEE